MMRKFEDLPKWRQRRIRRLAKKKGVDPDQLRKDRRAKWGTIVQTVVGPIVKAVPGKFDDKLLEAILDLIESADDDEE